MSEKKEHPDVTYIKNEDVGIVVAKALAVLYKVKPNNPCDYMARWMLNYAQVQKEKDSQERKNEAIKDLKEKGAQAEKNLKIEKESKRKEEENEKLKHTLFKKKIERSDDLADNLQDLANYLKNSTQATGVYIGELIRPKKIIEENDLDDAHIDNEAEEIIKYIHTTENHEFLLKEVLKKNQGLTHDVFIPLEEPADDKPVEEMTPEELANRNKFLELKAKPKNINVKEVVRESRMHYFRVPKLGSYLAVELKYDHCTNESSFDAAFREYNQTQERILDQKIERQEWEKEQEEIKRQKEEDGEQFYPEEKEWELIEEAPYKSETKRYVVSLDTMGQDRPLTDEQIEHVL